MSKIIANKFVQGVSIPRSGHHLLERLLHEYYFNFKYCEYYSHCIGSKCEILDLNLIKNHDFLDSLNIDDNIQYIFQYRHPLECWVSSVFLEIVNDHSSYIKNNNLSKDTHILNISSRIKNKYKNIALEKKIPYSGINFIFYWKRMMFKWCVPNYKNVFSINYDSLISNPLLMLKSINMLFSDYNFDSNFYITESVKKRDSITELLQLGVINKSEIYYLESFLKNEYKEFQLKPYLEL